MLIRDGHVKGAVATVVCGFLLSAVQIVLQHLRVEVVVCVKYCTGDELVVVV